MNVDGPGNFKTLQQAITEYSADAMRVALADAGDALDDANFEHGTANGAILRLTKELAWIGAKFACAHQRLVQRAVLTIYVVHAVFQTQTKRLLVLMKCVARILLRFRTVSSQMKSTVQVRRE